MNDEEYLQYVRQQWTDFCTILSQRTAALDDTEPLRQLALEFDQAAGEAAALYRVGPPLVGRLFTGFPEFAPTFPRELLWFLGGECLHYMPDAEIEVFQQLDELRSAAAARGEVIDFYAARAKLLKQH